MKEINLDVSKVNFPKHQKPVALVDDQDYEFLNQFDWYAIKGKGTFYAETIVNGKKVQMQNMIVWLSQFQNNETNTVN